MDVIQKLEEYISTQYLSDITIRVQLLTAYKNTLIPNLKRPVNM